MAIFVHNSSLQDQLRGYIKEGDLEGFKNFLEQNQEALAGTDHLNIALQDAALYGQTDIAKYLLDDPTNLVDPAYQRDDTGPNSLHCALFCKKPDQKEPIIRMLIGNAGYAALDQEGYVHSLVGRPESSDQSGPAAGAFFVNAVTPHSLASTDVRVLLSEIALEEERRGPSARMIDVRAIQQRKKPNFLARLLKKNKKRRR